MIIVWIIYFIVAIICSAFFVLYKDLLSLILLCVVLAVPIVLFIIHIISYLLTSIEVDVEESLTNQSKPTKIKVNVKNRSPFSATNIKLIAKCKNLFLNTEYDCRFVVNAKPFSDKTFTYEMASEHIGNIELSIKRAYFYDFFSLFCLTKKLSLSKVITVLPVEVPVTSTLRPNNYFTSESDTFSNTKAGDDPSEVFNIRDYIPGDKLNKVHWKLTSKMDHYMVKDYSLPVSEAVLIYVDLRIIDNTDDQLVLMDSLIKSFYSVSLNLTEQSIKHYICWYDSRRAAFNKQSIEKKEDLILAIRRMFSNSVFIAEPKMEKCDLFLNKRYSHLIFVTAEDAKDMLSQFMGFDLEISYKCVISVDYIKQDIPVTSSDIQFIPVIPEKEIGCLYNIKY